MSEEEKKALKVLSMMTFDINAGCKECPYKDMDIEEHNCIGCREDACEIVLNIVNRQQKEIEEKSTIIMAGAEKVKQLEKEIKELKRKQADDEMLTDTFIERNYIRRDKIRNKINKLYESDGLEDNIAIDYLKDLLKE